MTKRVEVIRLAVAVIEEDQKYLVTQRLETSIFPGLLGIPWRPYQGWREPGAGAGSNAGYEIGTHALRR